MPSHRDALISSATVDGRVTLQKLEVFCRVVELESVSRTAEELFLSQPGVSGHLRSLEAALGSTLLYWEGRQLRLTEAGTIAYEWASALLQRTREAMRAIEGVRDGTSGACVVGATSTVGTYLLPAVLLEARRLLPQMRMTLEVHATRDLAAALLDGRCDFAVVLADGPLSTPTLQSRRLTSAPLVAVAAPGHPATRAQSVRELVEHDFVCSPQGHPRRTTVDRLLRERGADRRRVTMELSPPEAIKHAVREGIGVALLYRCSLTEELATGTLHEIALPGPTPATGVFLCQRKGRRFTTGQQLLLDAVCAQLGAAEDPLGLV
ncbi:MAG: LysR family transcriptional regulator [Solirubrobacterales bacterium]|nr:LysR family transcriptional regulator [Solirubrobacterales bacterium]